MQIVDLLLPRRCGICGRVGESACASCLRPARALRTALVRALRSPRALAGPAVRGVQREEACVRERPCRARLRGGSPGVRRLVEGAWASRPHRRGGPARHRRAAAAGCACDRIRSRRSRPWAAHEVMCRRPRSRGALGRLVDSAAHGACGGGPGVARQRNLPRAERRQNVARAFTARGAGAARSLPRRRRLHDGVDRDRLRRCTSPGGSTAGRGGLPGQGGAVVQ